MAPTRRYSRLPFHSASTLTLGAGDADVNTELIDISLKGALVARPQGMDVRVGTPAVLSVHLEHSPVQIVMKTMVAHVRSGQVGLHCLSIDVDSMIHLRRLMELNLGDPELLERELLALG